MLPSPLPIRAHAVLCLQAFRGEGYSDAFVRRMAEVQEALLRDPGLEVLISTTPGVLCEACPHLDDGGCTLRGPDHEAHMHSQDELVLERLGLAAGDVLPWASIVDRIATAIRGRDLAAICTSCPWLARGWCVDALDALHVDAPSADSSGS